MAFRHIAKLDFPAEGLVKKYRKETSNVKTLKGKLEFAGNNTNNLNEIAEEYNNSHFLQFTLVLYISK